MLEQIRTNLRNTPFQRFEIRTDSGEVFRVAHPENAAVVGNQVVVALPDGQSAIMLSPLHMVSVSGTQSLAV